DTPFSRPSVPLIANVDARLLSEPDDLRAELAAQITASVRWVDVIQRAMEHGVSSLFEIGPGKVLSGLATRIGRQLETAHAEAFLGD
ncbi:MAG TPA: malonyl CoA-acyl carrier protein transacylase, partial [Nitrolancea sp.]